VSALTRSLWLVVLGLAVHALLDAFHGRVIDDAGVPAWWPSFCLTFDLAAALALAFVMVKARRPEGAAIPVPLNSGRGGRCGLDLGGSWPLN